MSRPKKTASDKATMKKPVVKTTKTKVESVNAEAQSKPIAVEKKTVVKKAKLVNPPPKFTAENHPNRRATDHEETHEDTVVIKTSTLPVMDDEDVRAPLLRDSVRSGHVKLLSMDDMFSLMASNSRPQQEENRFQKFLKR